ncbi:MAG: alcohol dehydrogenase catalytic domain-containing protein [Chloroflexi bacterium]|nr:alcohol dehydrogenase catalytic domain-containing protein [Chloroflexota bacterium]
MKALQIPRPGRFEIVDVPRPEPYADEVIVEIKAINSCTHWDLTVWDGIDLFGRAGHPIYPYPVGSPGHELSGVVVERGDQVTTVQVGDRVAYWGSPPGTRSFRPSGRAYGGYVQFYATHERSVLPFPEGLSWREMAMLEMLSCVGQGVVRAGDLTGQRVAVSGMGPAGLMMLQALKTLGPESLTAIDVQPDRCELAVSLGADRAVRPGSKDWADLREDEFTLSVDCSGVPAAIEGDLEHTAGRLIIFSVPEADFRVPQAARRRGTTIEYTRTPAGRPGKYARHLLVSGQVNVKPLLTHEIPIEEFDKGIDLLRRREAIKVTFDMGN